MAKKKQAADPGVQEALFGLSKVLNDDEAPDWSALDQEPLGELVALLGPLDAGVMIRSSERGASRSLGVFVGGQSQWTTCRDQRELLEMLRATRETLQALLGARTAPAPAAATQRPKKGPAGPTR